MTTALTYRQGVCVPKTAVDLTLRWVDPKDTALAVELSEGCVQVLNIDMLGVDEQEVMVLFFRLLLTRTYKYLVITTDKLYPQLEELVDDYFQRADALALTPVESLDLQKQI